MLLANAKDEDENPIKHERLSAQDFKQTAKKELKNEPLAFIWQKNPWHTIVYNRS